MHFFPTRIKNPECLSQNLPYKCTKPKIRLLHRMEEDSVGKSISFKEDNSLETSKSVKIYNNGTSKRRRLDGCFPFMEISIDPGVKSLKHLDSQKLKDGIKKWAKAVVVYARQVSSQRFGSSRDSGTGGCSQRFGSSRDSGSDG